jgi:hypothetical protein
VGLIQWASPEVESSLPADPALLKGLVKKFA